MRNAESVLLDRVRNIRAAIDGLREDMRDTERRMTSLESQIATLHGDFAGWF